MCVLQESIVREEFISLYHELDRWGQYVDEILNKFIKNEFHSAEHVQLSASHRVKDVDSYCQKVIYRKKYKEPLLDTTDKVGTRVVCLDRDDVDTVSEFIKTCSEWVLCNQSQDIETSTLENPELFTYKSNHFIIKPLPSYVCSTNIDYLTCEIQVRTILQHAYAEISHEAFYKKSTEKNNKAKHMLASSMAFIEAADEKFVQIYEAIRNADDFESELNNHIVSLYKSLCPDYDVTNYNEEITRKILNIYTLEELVEIDQGIDEFSKGSDENIGFVLEKFREESVLFKHPYILILFYGIIMYKNKTRDNWPFNHESLVQVAKAMNVSPSSLD